MRPQMLLCGLFLSLAVVGCGKKETVEAEVVKDEGVLEEIGGLVRYHEGAHKRPPAQLDDLAEYEPFLSAGYKALFDGECILIWNVGLSDDPAAAAKVLAYQKDTPTGGGFVLMQNGQVRKMSAEEFQAANKAKP